MNRIEIVLIKKKKKKIKKDNAVINFIIFNKI